MVILPKYPRARDVHKTGHAAASKSAMHLLASVASAAYTLRAPPPRLCADVALQPQILAFTPSLPCIDAASPIERVLSAPAM